MHILLQSLLQVLLQSGAAVMHYKLFKCYYKVSQVVLQIRA